MILNNNIKAGQRWKNATRHQIVEQDTEIRRKEVSKEISHFLNSYNLVK